MNKSAFGVAMVLLFTTISPVFAGSYPEGVYQGTAVSKCYKSPIVFTIKDNVVSHTWALQVPVTTTAPLAVDGTFAMQYKVTQARGFELVRHLDGRVASDGTMTGTAYQTGRGLDMGDDCKGTFTTKIQ